MTGYVALAGLISIFWMNVFPDDVQVADLEGYATLVPNSFAIHFFGSKLAAQTV
jgi:hypothetical protein